jgi:hypothetical protein
VVKLSAALSRLGGLKPVLKEASNRSAEALHPITPKPGVLGTPALRHPKSNANKANGPELKANG